MLNKVVFNDNRFILPDIQTGSIDLILTDAPYQISKDSNFDKSMNSKELEVKYGNISNDFGEWDKNAIDWLFYMKEFHRVLKRGGKVIMFYDIWKMNVIKSLGEELNFSQPRLGIWEKSNPIPINSKQNYLSNSKEYFISLTRHGWVGRSRAKSTFNSEYDNAIYKYPTIAGSEVTGHTTQKPVKLFEELITKHTNVNEVILDPFIGSGTTGVACNNMNRNFIGIENNHQYIEMCEKRGLTIE